MMDLGKVVLVGRHERANEDMKWLWEIFAAFQTRARAAMQSRWPDKIDAWDRWNVMALVQRTADSYGVIDFVEFHTYENLGLHPAPWMTERWRFVPMINHMDPEKIPSDPPVLHHSSRVLDRDRPPTSLSHIPAHERPGVWDRIKQAEMDLDREGVYALPNAGTKEGLKSALAFRNLRMVSDKAGTFLVEPLPPDEMAPVVSRSWGSLLEAER